MKVEFEYMKRTILGWSCPFCGFAPIFLEGALMHESGIDDRKGEGCFYLEQRAKEADPIEERSHE